MKYNTNRYVYNDYTHVEESCSPLTKVQPHHALRESLNRTKLGSPKSDQS
jgi:hypothetical protein